MLPLIVIWYTLVLSASTFINFFNVWQTYKIKYVNLNLFDLKQNILFT